MSTSTQAKKAQYVTPDYSVSIRDVTKAETTVFTIEELEASHGKFVEFRDGLRTRGFLPADSNENEDLSFTQDKPGNRSICLRVVPFYEFQMALFESHQDVWNFSSLPDMYFFQAHLQRAKVHGFPILKMQQLHNLHVTNLEDKINPNKKELNLHQMGITYDECLQLMDSLAEILGGILKKNGIEPTIERIIRFWALTRFAELGHSVVPSSKGPVNNKALTQMILGLVESDVRLYTAIAGISRQANPTYAESHEFAFTVEGLKELSDVPKEYLKYLLLK